MARGALSHLLQLLPPLPPTAARVEFSTSGAAPRGLRSCRGTALRPEPLTGRPWRSCCALRGLRTGLAGTAQHEHRQTSRETCRGWSARLGAHWRGASGGAEALSDGRLPDVQRGTLRGVGGEDPLSQQTLAWEPECRRAPGQADLLPGADTDLDITFLQGFSGAPSPAATCTLFLLALAGRGPGGPQGGGCWGLRPCLRLCSRVGHP